MNSEDRFLKAWLLIFDIILVRIYTLFTIKIICFEKARKNRKINTCIALQLINTRIILMCKELKYNKMIIIIYYKVEVCKIHNNLNSLLLPKLPYSLYILSKHVSFSFVLSFYFQLRVIRSYLQINSKN